MPAPEPVPAQGHRPGLEHRPALEQRTALITGGASGIGRAIAEAYLREGAQVVLADLDAERAATDIGATGHVAVDVSDPGSVAGAVSSVLDRFGRIDVLVNSAGILTEAPLVEMDPKVWAETIAVDLTGVFLCCRYVVPHMVERRWGRVINIASQLGIKGGRSLSHYAAAKAGVIGLTKSLALEVAEHNVLVNAIAPGPVETPLVAGITDEWKAAKRAELPLGRFGRPEEIAPTAVLLAGDPGGNLYVGQTLGPNSGDVMP
ncbi:3-oxoacyl-ACP reductase family protein [Nonomuraea sp. NPDC049158]|uniref:SDR family NAD(P)-dependent oxidoreductase n=1 Tax=Nonomuraea sp. NPDC049158 TaxID=3155649 RepID=UPI0033CBE4AA